MNAMIKSMTGFGRGEAHDLERQFVVEVKSVNHRYNDIVARMPKRLSYLEEQLKELVKDKIKRGRVEIFVTLESKGQSDTKISLNLSLARQYYESIKEIQDNFPVIDDISSSVLSRFPDVLRIETKEENEDEMWLLLKKAAIYAIEMLVLMRKSEGEILANDILSKSQYITSIVSKIVERAPKVIEEYRVRLRERLNELLDESMQVDQNRINMEIILHADRSCIDEEIVRLKSHIIQLEKSCNDNQPIGRKLDFIIQEMNREINTIGSKANDLEIINYVVEIKSELEKTREQVQNIE